MWKTQIFKRPKKVFWSWKNIVGWVAVGTPGLFLEFQMLESILEIPKKAMQTKLVF